MDIIGQQWYDSNAQRNYPLFDTASRLDVTSTFEIPNDLIVDARIAAPADYSPTEFFISKISAYGAGLVITIACTGKGDVASVTVPLDGFVEFSSFQIAPLPGNPQVGGAMVIGTSGAAIAAGSGVYTFLVAATRLLPTVVYPAAPSVASITFVDSFGVSTQLTGAITLSAGPNAAISIDSQTIEVGMETGVLIEDPCDCRDTGGLQRSAIKSINGVTPDDAGNIQIVPVGCPAITAGTASLALNDQCAQPCCGDAEMTALADQTKGLAQNMATIANKVAEVEAGLRTLLNYTGG